MTHVIEKLQQLHLVLFDLPDTQEISGCCDQIWPRTLLVGNEHDLGGWKWMNKIEIWVGDELPVFIIHCRQSKGEKEQHGAACDPAGKLVANAGMPTS